MALNFPNTPNIGDQYTPAGLSQTYEWDGTKWVLLAPTGSGLQNPLTEDLDVGTYSIISSSDRDIAVTPNGTGNVLLGTLPFDADQTVGAGQDQHVLTYFSTSGEIILAPAPGGGGGGNAWSDPVDADIVPTGASSTYDLGSTTFRFAEGYIDDLIVTDAITAGGDITGANLSGVNTGNEVQATELQIGIAEIATQGETDTGTDDKTIVTPLKLANYSGFLKEVKDDASPELGGDLRTGGAAYLMTDVGDVVQGYLAQSLVEPGNPVILGRSTDGTAINVPGDARLVLISGEMDLEGTSIRVPTLGGGADDNYAVQVTSEGLLYATPGPEPGWQEPVDTDTDDYPLGSGATVQPWVEMTGLFVTLSQDVASGTRVNAIATVQATNSTNFDGTIDIGIGLNSADPTNFQTFPVPSGFDSTVVMSVSTATLVATTGDTLNVKARIKSGSNSNFSVSLLGTTTQHELEVWSQGTGGGGVGDGDYGDITVSLGGTQWDINAGAVSNDKRADMAAWTLSGRNAGTTGVPGDFTVGDLAVEGAPTTGDKLLGWDNTGQLVSIDVGALPTGGGGEVNTGVNVGTGAALVDGPNVGLSIPIRGLNALSPRISVSEDVPGQKVDFDVNEANIDALNLANAPAEAGATADAPATQPETDAGTNSEKFVTPLTLENFARLADTSGSNTGDEPVASTTVEGVVELATQAEVDAGTSGALAVTPETLAAYSGIPTTYLENHPFGIANPVVGAVTGAEMASPGTVTRILVAHAGSLDNATVMVRKKSTYDGATTDLLTAPIVSTTGGVLGTIQNPSLSQFDILEVNITAVGGTTAVTDQVIVNVHVSHTGLS